MKKIKIIFAIIIVLVAVYLIWNFFEIKNLRTDNEERENIKQLAVETIESLHRGNSEFLSNISGTEQVRKQLFERMDALKNSKYNNIEIMGTRVTSRNIYTVVVFFSGEPYNYLEYTLEFKKKNDNWKIVNLQIF